MTTNISKAASPCDSARSAFTLIELLVVIALIAILAALLLPALSYTNGCAKSAVCKSNLHQLGIGLSLYVSDFEKYPLYGYLVYVPNVQRNWRGPYWDNVLQPYCGSTNAAASLVNSAQNIFRCPANPRSRDWSSGLSLYSYNSWGTFGHAGPPFSTLGLGIFGAVNAAVSESRVQAPSAMLAIGEMAEGGFGWPGRPGIWDPRPRGGAYEYGGDYFHNRRNNALLCDGHVESGNSDAQKEAIPGMPEGDPWQYRYKPTAAHSERWNNDHQPHPETW